MKHGCDPTVISRNLYKVQPIKNLLTPPPRKKKSSLAKLAIGRLFLQRSTHCHSEQDSQRGDDYASGVLGRKWASSAGAQVASVYRLLVDERARASLLMQARAIEEEKSAAADARERKKVSTTRAPPAFGSPQTIAAFGGQIIPALQREPIKICALSRAGTMRFHGAVLGIAVIRIYSGEITKFCKIFSCIILGELIIFGVERCFLL